MLAPWLLYASALAALLGLIALLVERIARWRAQPARWIWLGAIAAMVVIPVGLSFRPSPPDSLAQAPHANGSFRFDQAPTLPDAPLLTLWLLASILLASRIVGTAITLKRRRNRWVPATLEGHSILLADHLGPAVIGWRRPTTIIPRWALSLDERSRALILQHEAEHARSGDPYLRSAALLALVIMPWNPAIWWAMRRLRLAVEIDCDQRVLSRGVNAHYYATLLLTVGERMASIPFAWATALGGSRSFLERRILAMTTPLRRSRSAIISVGAGIALIVAVACEAPIPDPVAPSFMSGADTAREPTETLKEVTGVAYLVIPDCETGTICGRDSTLELEFVTKSGFSLEKLKCDIVTECPQREVRDTVLDIRTVVGRRGEAITVRDDLAGAVREVRGVLLVPTESTPR